MRLKTTMVKHKTINDVLLRSKLYVPGIFRWFVHPKWIHGVYQYKLRFYGTDIFVAFLIGRMQFIESEPYIIWVPDWLNSSLIKN